MSRKLLNIVHLCDLFYYFKKFNIFFNLKNLKLLHVGHYGVTLYFYLKNTKCCIWRYRKKPQHSSKLYRGLILHEICGATIDLFSCSESCLSYCMTLNINITFDKRNQGLTLRADVSDNYSCPLIKWLRFWSPALVSVAKLQANCISPTWEFRTVKD